MLGRKDDRRDEEVEEWGLMSHPVNTTPLMTCFAVKKCAQNGYREKVMMN